MTMRLTVTDLTIMAGDVRLVTGASFTIAPYEALTLLGESGSGKSLIMHAIMGSLPHGITASGSIRLGDRDLMTLPPRDRRALWGRVLSLLPQEPWLALDPTMTVQNQVAEGHRLVRARSGDDALAAAGHDLAAVGLAQAAALYPFQMSGGMCQRAAIAILHGARSDLILADEPTKGLDTHLRNSSVARLRAEADDGRLLLTITHDIAVARTIGGTVAVMRDGRIVEQGPADTVLERPAHAFTRALIDAEPSRWPKRASTLRPDEPVIAAHGLTRRIGDRSLFEDLDIAVRPGEIVAVTGRSGSGKTMLGNILLGLVTPDGGTVTRRAGARAHQFQKIYQDPPASFAPHEPLRRGLADLIARHRLDPRKLDGLLERLAIDPSMLVRLPGEVSGGELQRLAIARALMLDPVFLFADEATSRLDLLRQQEVMGLLADLAAERGTGLLLVSHDPDLAATIADRRIDLDLLQQPDMTDPA